MDRSRSQVKALARWLVALLGMGCAADPPPLLNEDVSAIGTVGIPGTPHIGLNHATCSYMDLASAVAAASPGDTVLLEEGWAFFTSGVKIGKDLTIRTGSSSCTKNWDGTGFLAVLNGTSSGQIAAVTGTVTFRDVNLREGSGTTGGALSVTGVHTLTLNNVRIEASTAQKGGAIYAAAGAQVVLKGTTMITNNTVTTGGLTDEGGAGVYLDDATLTMLDSAAIRDANSSDLHGGGVFALDSIISLYDWAQIDRNWAFQSGGGVYLRGGVLGLFDHSSIGGDGNTARFDGGGIWGDHIQLSAALGTHVDGNEAGGSGGGVHVRNLTYVALTGTTVEGNTAGDDGGGVWSDDSQLTLDGIDITGNSAGSSGGGLFMMGNLSSTLVTDAGEIDGNVAGTDGGGIALSTTTATLQGTRVSLNSAQSGGGLAIEDGGAVTGASLLVQHNSATYGGGIMMIGDATLTMDGAQNAGACVGGQFVLAYDTYCSEVRANSASSLGGGLFAFSGLATFDRTAFIENSAVVDGAAIYLLMSDSASRVDATNTLFHNNTTGANGAVVEVQGGTVFNANQVTMARDAGYAVRYDGGAGRIFRSIVDDAGGVFILYPYVLPANDSLIRVPYGTTSGPNRTFGVPAGFVNTARGPLRIALGLSPNAVDRCTSGEPVDLDSSPRPAYVRFDRGAFEAQ